MVALIFVIVALWIIGSVKTTRGDGELISRIHPYRKIMQYIMPTRNESIVYFDEYINAEKLLAYAEEAKKSFGADITHCLVGATGAALLHNPAMNRFVVGRRLYQRFGHYITFSMKRKRQDKKSKLSVVKIPVSEGQTFKQLVSDIEAKINVERSDKVTYADKEFSIFNAIPRPFLRAFVVIFKTLDYFNCLPQSFIRNDALYSSIVLTNLGSVGMDAGYHHLYEWGTCPLFLTVGKVTDLPVVRDGQIVAQKTLHIRFSYDERIEDGMTAGGGITALKKILEDPYNYLGCVKSDGGDLKKFGDYSL